MSTKTSSERLAEFVLGLDYERIPRSTRTAAKLHMLDALGVSLAVSRSETADAIRRTIRRLGGTAESTVIGAGERFPAPAAALANATMAHTPDFDDTHGGSIIHPSSVVASTALAVGESSGRSGEEILTAAVAGYESLLRLGLAAPGKFHEGGFHPTAVCGVFGAILISARLRSLGVETTRNALGIGGSQAAGLLEFLADGSSAKQIHPGWASYAGIFATLLAEDGVTGPKTVLEGRHGLYNTHLGEGKYDLESHLGTLGRKWETDNISYKLYPCCHFLMAFIDCARKIRGSSPMRSQDVEEIEVIVAPEEAKLVCEPLDAKRAPRGTYDAKFSLPYTVAVALSRGNCVLDDFTEERLGDQAVLDLAAKVRSVPCETTGFPNVFPGWVRVRLRNGTVLEHREKVQRGGPENPADDGEIVAKFENNARRVLSPEKVAEIRDQVMGLEKLPNIGPLMKNLARAGQPQEVR